MASFENRSGRIRAVVRYDNKKYSKTFDSKSEATFWAASIEAGYTPKEATAKRHNPASFRLILEKYLAEITPKKRSANNEKIMIEGLLKHEGIFDVPLDELTKKHFNTFRDILLENLKPSSVRRYFDIIKHASIVAHEDWEWVSPHDIVPKVTVSVPPPGNIERVTDNMLNDLYNASLAATRVIWMVPLIKVALGTALRRKELTDLDWHWIDFDKKLIFVNKTKNTYSRIIPMSVEVEQTLTVLWLASETQAGKVFDITPNAIKLAFARLLKASGVKMRFHDLRHEAISRLFEQGLTPIEVASISGHRTLKTLMRYSHADVNATLAKLRGVLS